MTDLTLEEKVFSNIEIWPPLTSTRFSQIAMGNPLESALLQELYNLVKNKKFPRRKDGKPQMVHPLTVVHYLQRANAPLLSQAAGMMHDYSEDLAERACKSMGFKMPEDVAFFDSVEEQMMMGMAHELSDLLPEEGVSGVTASSILAVVDLVTRHKREMYYKSMGRIFSCEDPEIKEAAIQVKLSDRLHSPQSLKGFDPRGRNYQCFKNVFILNAAKRHLIETGQISTDSNPEQITPTEKLFRKCCKATYQSFWGTLVSTRDKRVVEYLPYIHLAFSKYNHMHEGLGQVTEFNPKEEHPLWLFQAVVKKYDAWLHKEEDEHRNRESLEKQYCRDLFPGPKLTDKQAEALVIYKDAFALKAIVERLLYNPSYVVDGFGCSSMCSRSNVCSLDVCKS